MWQQLHVDCMLTGLGKGLARVKGGCPSNQHCMLSDQVLCCVLGPHNSLMHAS